jgi:cytochrome c oxidase accessory protein FixG
MSQADRKLTARQAAQAETGAMYAAREKIYPREVKGPFQSLRNLAVVLLLGVFYGLAWLRWDGRQAVLFDLPARKFHVFGLTFWPQDFFYLALLLVIAALSLFFFTALAGRLWCGYACPQTVWTEAFLWMERWTEGGRPQRMKLDAGPWNFNKLWRKSAKQALWVAFALWTGFTFVGYFTPITELGAKLLGLRMGHWETFWVLFYGFATYGNAGFLREQVCLYMCPYARFQSAMFDRDTLIISYDGKRGEPRGSRSRGADYKAAGLGDCIDCTLCVQACPTGIDIRDGLQYECIACAACIDACNGVMDRMNYPRGLIRYSTQRAMDQQPTRVLRPRTLIYGALLAGLFVALLTAIALRVPLAMDVLHDRNALFRPVEDGGKIENVYMLKVMNRDTRPRRYTLAASGLDGIEIENYAEGESIEVPAGAVANVPVRVRAPAERLHGGHDIQLMLTTVDQPTHTVTETARFFGPVPGRDGAREDKHADD